MDPKSVSPGWPGSGVSNSLLEVVEQEQLEQFRAALTGHCYRMLGSAADADDAVQEALLRAWQRRQQLQQPEALGGWLYRIATNVCLDLLAHRKRRARPMDEAAGTPFDADMRERPHEHWLEPIAEAAIMPPAATPQERALLRESTRLAFVAALQHLPPRQRAAFLLVELLGCSAVEVGTTLDMTVPAVNSAVQRARAKLPARDTSEQQLTAAQAQLLERYVAAFERFSVEELVALMREDATYSMPPFALWLHGAEAIATWLGKYPGNTCKGSRLVRANAAGNPAFGQYRPAEGGGYKPWSLIVLELSDGGRISGVNNFLDVEQLFPRFGLPAALD